MKKDTKKVKPGKTDKPEKKSKKQVKKAVEEPKATKTRKSRKVEEPEVKPTKQAKVKKVEKPEVNPGMDLAALCKERHHIAAKISNRKKAGKDVTELKEQEKAIVELIRKIKYAGTSMNPTKAKKAIEEPKRIVETPKTPKVIRVKDLLVQTEYIPKDLNMDEQPSNEIWYTTTDGKPADINNGNFGKDVVAKTNTFDGKKGVISCNGVITEIGSTAFFACDNLASVSLPKSVEIINTYAFMGCPLTTLVCKSVTPPLLGLNILTNGIKCTIKVPAKSVKAYKSANGWGFYKDIIGPSK